MIITVIVITIVIVIIIIVTVTIIVRSPHPHISQSHPTIASHLDRLPRGFHRRGSGPDSRLVLHADGDLHVSLQ